MTAIDGIRIDAAPGVVLYRATAPFADDDGTEYPAGTEYTPLAGGLDDGRPYQTVRVGVRTVTVRRLED